MVVSRRGASGRTPRVSFKPSRSARILIGECVAEMAKLPAASVDLVFADPPYNLQLQGDLRRPDDSRVDAVDEPVDRHDGVARRPRHLGERAHRLGLQLDDRQERADDAVDARDLRHTDTLRLDSLRKRPPALAAAFLHV